MTTIETLLLVLIATGFLVILIIGILIAFTVLKVMQNVRRISEKLEATTDNLGETVKAVTKKLLPLAGTSVVGAVMRKIKHKKRED